MQNSAALKHSSTMMGIVLMCVGVACLCINDALAKTLTANYSPIQIQLMRNLVALPFAILIALKMGGKPALRSHRPMAHVLRGTLWIGATIMFFTSLKYLGLAEATALIFVAPLFITALSALLFRDPVGWRRWLAVIVGFIGILIAIRPGTSTFQPVSLLPIATAVVYALLMLSARFVDERESVWTLLLYMTGTGAVMGLFLIPFVWVPIRMDDIGLFIAVAIFGTAGMTMMTQAFRLAPAVVVAPMDYTAIIWATLLGWLLWKEIPDTLTYLGAAIVIASGIYIIFREHRTAS